MVALLIYSFIALTGCIYLVVGGIGALGGYVVSPDTVEGMTENEKDLVWDAAIEILSIIGLIEEENEEGGVIFASVHNAKVTVTIASLNSNTTKLTVKARKAYLPRISIAQEIFVKIMSRLSG